MAGGDRVGVEPARAIQERRELQVAVAVHAGDGRPPRRVLADEIRQDALLELALEVDDVVRNAERARHAPRVVQVVDRAAAPEAEVSLPLVVQLHREADDLVPLRRELCGGDR